jgi:hypothetical protein
MVMISPTYQPFTSQHMMFDPDSVLERWAGMIDNNFQKTIQETFGLSEDDNYKPSQ